jgi:hypothetical protein
MLPTSQLRANLRLQAGLKASRLTSWPPTAIDEGRSISASIIECVVAIVDLEGGPGAIEQVC